MKFSFVVAGLCVASASLGMIAPSADAQSIVCYQYDELGRLVAADYQDDAADTSSLTHSYDANHNITDTSTATSGAPTCPTPVGTGMDTNVVPVEAVDDVVTHYWDGVSSLSFNVDVLANDLPVSATLDLVSVESVLPAGSAQLASGDLVDFSGSGVGQYRFGYRVEDQNGFVDTGRAYVDVKWNPVEAVNDSYVLEWDGTSANPATAAYDVLANDLPVGATRTLESVSLTSGSATAMKWYQDLNQVLFHATAVGTYSVSYDAMDQDGNLDTAIASIEVRYIPVVASNDSYSLATDASGNASSTLYVLDNDGPQGQVLTLTNVTGTTGSPTVSIGSGGINFSVSAVGTYGFTYTVQDTYGNTDTATAIVVVENTNVYANDDSYSLTYNAGGGGQSYPLSVLANDVPTSGLQITNITKLAGTGTATVNGAGTVVTFTATGSTTAIFQYTAENASGVQDTALIEIEVTSQGGGGGEEN